MLGAVAVSATSHFKTMAVGSTTLRLYTDARNPTPVTALVKGAPVDHEPGGTLGFYRADVTPGRNLSSRADKSSRDP